MQLFNPTNENLTFMFGGSNYTIPAGKIRELPEAVGNHLLVHLAQRGLVELKHGDNQKKKAEDGRAANMEFKKRQITTFRKMNETRVSEGLPPVFPQKHILDMIEELEGSESRERLEYHTQETADMMMKKMVDGQVRAQDSMATAMSTLADAISAMATQQEQNQEILQALFNRVVKGEDE